MMMKMMMMITWDCVICVIKFVPEWFSCSIILPQTQVIHVYTPT